jgi:hypothetical protein
MYFGGHFVSLEHLIHLLVLAQAPKYKRHMLLPAKVRKVSYSLA